VDSAGWGTASGGSALPGTWEGEGGRRRTAEVDGKGGCGGWCMPTAARVGVDGDDGDG
jgi:hypothetical protein